VWPAEAKAPPLPLSAPGRPCPAIQLTLAIRLHRAQGRQLPLIVSGGLSTIAGIAFIAGSGMDHAHLAMVAGYMALGALLFLLSAVLTPTVAPTGR
jgi:hypothetical protein